MILVNKDKFITVWALSFPLVPAEFNKEMFGVEYLYSQSGVTFNQWWGIYRIVTGHRALPSVGESSEDERTNIIIAWA